MIQTSIRNEPYYGAFLDLVRLASLLRKAGDRFFRKRGITQAQFNVLMLLKHEAPSGCSQNQLCKMLLVEPADVTGLIRRMLRTSLLTREDHPKDERAWVIRISREGRALLDRVEPSYYQKVVAMMGAFKPSQLKELSALFRKTQEALRDEAA